MQKIAYGQSIYTARREGASRCCQSAPARQHEDRDYRASLGGRRQPAGALLANWRTGQLTLNRTSSGMMQSSALVNDAQFYRVTQTSMEPLLTSDRLEVEIQRKQSLPGSEIAFDVSTRVDWRLRTVRRRLPPGSPSLQKSQRFCMTSKSRHQRPFPRVCASGGRAMAGSR